MAIVLLKKLAKYNYKWQMKHIFFYHLLYFGVFILTKCNNLGADEFQWAKIDVKMSTFLEFLFHLSMWCHYNSMWIMESCAYWIMWTLKNLKWIKQNSNIKVWFEYKTFNNFIQWHHFHKGPINFHNTIYFILNIFIIIGYY
jgi:hypothetical protein